MKTKSLSKLASTIVLVSTLMFGVPTNLYGDDSNEKEDAEYEWGPVSEGYRLSIQAEKKAYAYCEPIILRVYLKNVGEERVAFGKTRPGEYLKAVVKNDKGESVPLTAYGRHLRDFLLGPQTYPVKLDPGQKDKSYFLVNRIHDMTRGVKYSITAKYYVRKRAGKGSAVVVSKTIRIQVKGDPLRQREELERLIEKAHSDDETIRQKAVGQLLVKLRKGMSRKEVEKWIGPPAKVIPREKIGDKGTLLAKYYCQLPGDERTMLMTVHYTKVEKEEFLQLRAPHFPD